MFLAYALKRYILLWQRRSDSKSQADWSHCLSHQETENEQEMGQDYNLKVSSQWSLCSNKALSPRSSTAFLSSITNLWSSVKAYEPLGDISHSNYNIYVTYKNPALAKLGMDTFNPITWKTQSDECLWVRYQHGLYIELQISHSETMSQKKSNLKYENYGKL